MKVFIQMLRSEKSVPNSPSSNNPVETVEKVNVVILTSNHVVTVNSK